MSLRVHKTVKLKTRVQKKKPAMITSSRFMDFILNTFYLCCEYTAVPCGPAYVMHGRVLTVQRIQLRSVGEEN